MNRLLAAAALAVALAPAATTLATIVASKAFATTIGTGTDGITYVQPDGATRGQARVVDG